MNGMIKICEKSVVGEVELTGPVTDILYIVILGDHYIQRMKGKVKDQFALSEFSIGHLVSGGNLLLKDPAGP